MQTSNLVNSKVDNSNSKSNQSINNSRQAISEETKNRLTALSTRLDEQLSRNNNSSSDKPRYIKLIRDNEHKLLEFDPNKIDEKMVTFESEPDVPKQRFTFYCKEIVDGKPTTEDYQQFDVPPTVCNNIVKWLKQGFVSINITRKGLGLSTKYDIMPQL
jgi:hypothetical protein